MRFRIMRKQKLNTFSVDMTWIFKNDTNCALKPISSVAEAACIPSFLPPLGCLNSSGEHRQRWCGAGVSWEMIVMLPEPQSVNPET